MALRVGFRINSVFLNTTHISKQSTGYWLRFYIPLDTKQVILQMLPKPISWLDMEETKPNTIKAHIRQSNEMSNNTK